MSLSRIITAALVLIAGTFATQTIRPSPPPPQHRLLRDFPSTIALWHSRDLPFEDDSDLGVDDYTNREYLGGDQPVELYIGYYKDQRSGDAIHSPKNCLPGSGWEPVRSSMVQIGPGSKPITVNEYIVEQGSNQDLVFYWYQTHGRVVAGEYAAKFWLMADGLRRRSTDGDLIRIWTTARDGPASAEARAAAFASQVYPEIKEFLPN